MNQSTIMREAFCNMTIKGRQHHTHAGIIHAAIKSAEQNAGVHHVREWNAHLKLGTFNALKFKGIM